MNHWHAVFNHCQSLTSPQQCLAENLLWGLPPIWETPRVQTNSLQLGSWLQLDMDCSFKCSNGKQGQGPLYCMQSLLGGSPTHFLGVCGIDRPRYLHPSPKHSKAISSCALQKNVPTCKLNGCPQLPLVVHVPLQPRNLFCSSWSPTTFHLPLLWPLPEEPKAPCDFR